MNMYSCIDYRKVLKERVKSLSKEGHTLAKLALACKVQQSYLSRVLAGACDLNNDQMFLAMKHLKFSEKEQSFLNLLLDYSRCSLVERKMLIERQIADFQETEQSALRNQLAIDSAIDSAIEAYYQDPLAQVVHIFLHVPRYRSAHAATAIGKNLGVSADRIAATITVLEKCGLISISKTGQISNIKDDIHLPSSHRLHRQFQISARIRALNRILTAPLNPRTPEDLNYNLCFSADPRCIAKLKHVFNEFLEKARLEIGPAPSKEVYQLQFDLFRLSV